jgi:hypothetical protein
VPAVWIYKNPNSFAISECTISVEFRQYRVKKTLLGLRGPVFSDGECHLGHSDTGIIPGK